EDGIRDPLVTGVQTCALPISRAARRMLVHNSCSVTWWEQELVARNHSGLVSHIPSRFTSLYPARARGTACLLRANAGGSSNTRRSEERRVGKESRPGCRAKHR